MGKIAVFDLAIAEFILQGDHVAGEKLPLSWMGMLSDSFLSVLQCQLWNVQYVCITYQTLLF